MPCFLSCFRPAALAEIKCPTRGPYSADTFEDTKPDATNSYGKRATQNTQESARAGLLRNAYISNTLIRLSTHKLSFLPAITLRPLLQILPAPLADPTRGFFLR